MKRQNLIIIIFIIVFILVSFVVYSQSSGSTEKLKSKTTESTAPRSISFDKISPFPASQTSISFFPALSTQPSFPESLPSFSTSSFSFDSEAKRIATAFSFTGEPVVLDSSPSLLRWNNKDFSLLFMESTNSVEYSRLDTPQTSKAPSMEDASKTLISFLNDKKILPENFSISFAASYPIISTENMFEKAPTASSANALLVQGLLLFKNLPFITGFYTYPSFTAILDNTGIRKLTLVIPPQLSSTTQNVTLNSSGVISNIQANQGKVVLVFSQKAVKETDTQISIEAVGVQTISAGFVWDKDGKLVEPAFIASGRDRSTNSLIYYLVPNTP